MQQTFVYVLVLGSGYKDDLTLDSTEIWPPFVSHWTTLRLFDDHRPTCVCVYVRVCVCELLQEA